MSNLGELRKALNKTNKSVYKTVPLMKNGIMRNRFICIVLFPNISIIIKMDRKGSNPFNQKVKFDNNDFTYKKVVGLNQ